MIEDVAKYFLNLKGSELKQKSGAFVLSDRGTQPVQENVFTRELLGTAFYEKEFVSPSKATAAIASAKMYADIGILTPPPFVVLRPDIVAGKNNIDLITQDINSLEDFEFTPAFDVLGAELRSDYPSRHKKDKWALLHDSKTREIFLKYVTPECLDQIINLFLLDELRTDSDRHLNNYFLYKARGSSKYQGIAVIDLENVEALIDGNAHSKSGFRRFINKKYTSTLPNERIDELSHIDRMHRILNILNAGLLSDSNISALRTAVAYDFPGTIKSTQKNITPLRDIRIYDTFARLWGHNGSTIGKDLGL